MFFCKKKVEEVADRYLDGWRVGQWMAEEKLKEKDEIIARLQSKIESLKLATKGVKNANKTRKAARK